MGKRLPQRYYITMKMSHDLSFITESPWQRNDAIITAI